MKDDRITGIYLLVQMRERIGSTIMLPAVVVVALCLCSSPTSLASDKPASGAVMQKAPKEREAITREYARLKARGTREALELFIERHPGDPLADQAREEIERLYGKD